MRKLITILLFLSTYAFAESQTKTYFVNFKDKGNITYEPNECLSQRAIDRYNQNNITFSYEDYKVYAPYVTLVRQFAEVLYPTKWHNGVITNIEDNNIDKVRALSCVESVTFIGYGFNTSRSKKKVLTQRPFLSSVEEIRRRKELLGIDELEKAQFDGSGVWVAVIDAGFEGVNTFSYFSHLYTEDRIIETFDVLTGENYVYRYHDHGTSCLGSIVGIDDTLKLGAAPNAKVGLYITENVNIEQPVEMYWWAVAMERIDSIGYDVVSNSLGYIDFDIPFSSPSYTDFDGETLVISKTASIAGTKGLIVVTSVGNEGNKAWKYLGAPADAYNVISVGAVDVAGNIGAFSSFGPTADGRVKPEVCGVGVSTNVVTKTGDLSASNGTSYSAPQIAGVMAVLKQKYPLYTREELNNVLFESSSQYTSPDNQYGFGVPNVATQILSIEEEVKTSFLNYSYKVFSLEGKLINKEYSNLSNGVYVIKYEVDNDFFVEKVVKL